MIMIVIAIMIMMMLMRYRDLNRACDQEQARLGRESVLKDNKTAEIWSKLGNEQIKESPRFKPLLVLSHLRIMVSSHKIGQLKSKLLFSIFILRDLN